MKGCLTTIAIILFLGLIISFPIATLGILVGGGLMYWGFFERGINKKLGAKSKKPIAIVFIGLFILISGCAVQSGQDEGSSPNENQSEELADNQNSIDHQDEDGSNSEGKTEDDSASENEDATGNQETENNSEQTETEKPTESGTDEEVKPKEPSPPASDADSQDQNGDFVTAIVTRVVDGDTVKVNIDGEEDTLRLLLVDTPETVAPNTPVQPFGKEASNFAKETLTGKEVQLEFDGPKRDKYDRLLVYLWIGDQMFNEMLLEGGYARLAYVYDPPYTHFDAYMKAQNRAKDKKLRIWSREGYVQKDGFDENEEESSSNGDGSYASCSEAREAGVTPLYKGEPGYGTHLDGDGDGVACE